MRTFFALLVALTLVAGAAGTVLAECGGGHTDTVSNPPTQPHPQS
jgi:hypothetical protein